MRQALLRRLEWHRRLNDPELSPGNRSPWLAGLRAWQAGRLRTSFADFLADPKTRDAAEFFLDDLYADRDFSARDRDMSRLLPAMARLLPERVLAAALGTVELAALSHAFDLKLARRLAERFPGPVRIDARRYGDAYRAVGCRRLRGRQIGLIVEVGEHLDWAVHKHGVERLLRLSRGPARLAGLSALQLFLERGFTAFRHLDGADDFLSRIAAQEREVARRLFGDHPRPFPPFESDD